MYIGQITSFVNPLASFSMPYCQYSQTLGQIFCFLGQIKPTKINWGPRPGRELDPSANKGGVNYGGYTVYIL